MLILVLNDDASPDQGPYKFADELKKIIEKEDAILPGYGPNNKHMIKIKRTRQQKMCEICKENIAYDNFWRHVGRCMKKLEKPAPQQNIDKECAICGKSISHGNINRHIKTHFD